MLRYRISTPPPLSSPTASGWLGVEEVDVPFVICLEQRGPFRFFVDVLGVEQK
jgi:hypothetical protein